MDPKIRLTSIKTFVLTAFAVLLAIGFLGATSAIAETTALCKSDESPCASENLVTSVHETSVGKTKLLTSLGTIECNVLFATTKVGGAASPQKLEGSFTYTNCELGGSNCTLIEENGPAEILVNKEGGETAKVTGERLAHLVCSGFIDCSYNGLNLAGTAKGPLLSTQANGEVTLSEQTTNKETGGFLCPKTAKLDITTSPLSATYIGNGSPPAPENTAPPIASPETPDQAVPETTTNGMWTNQPTSYSYQWERCNASGGECTNISGATKATYTPIEADVEHTLISKVTAENSGGNTSAESKATNKVKPVGSITEFSITGTPKKITSGPDGNLWFAKHQGISKITTSGKATNYTLPTGSYAEGIVEGPDSNLWFASWYESGAAKIGKVTTSGTVTEYELPNKSVPEAITSGPDGNLWFSANGSSKIGKITTLGSITEYALPEKSHPAGITTGPDGNLWFTEQSNNIGKITTSGTITEYPVAAKSRPWGITTGPDGSLWFAEGLSSKIGKITTSGLVTEYALPTGSEPSEITTGLDGNLWFTETHSSKIGRITTAGSVTEYVLPELSSPYGITVGSDDNIWFTDRRSGMVGNITP